MSEKKDDTPVDTMPPETSAEDRETQASQAIDEILRKHRCRIAFRAQLVPKHIGDGEQMLIDSQVHYGVQALP